MNIDDALDIDPTTLDPAVWCPGVLRLARRVNAVRPRLDAVLRDPVDRALAGLDAPPDPAGLMDTPLRALGACQAMLDGDLMPDVGLVQALEKTLTGAEQGWVEAARVHVQTSPDREREGRIALSFQALPYVFPGELHPLVVNLLAVSDRVMPALHVDWARKLSTFVSAAIGEDIKSRGLWFWPHLGVLHERQVARPLRKLRLGRRIPVGGRGLVAAYLWRLGEEWGAPVAEASATEQWVAAVAISSERPQ